MKDGHDGNHDDDDEDNDDGDDEYAWYLIVFDLTNRFKNWWQFVENLLSRLFVFFRDMNV